MTVQIWNTCSTSLSSGFLSGLRTTVAAAAAAAAAAATGTNCIGFKGQETQGEKHGDKQTHGRLWLSKGKSRKGRALMTPQARSSLVSWNWSLVVRAFFISYYSTGDYSCAPPSPALHLHSCDSHEWLRHHLEWHKHALRRVKHWPLALKCFGFPETFERVLQRKSTVGGGRRYI